MKLALKITPGARRNECLGWEGHPQAGTVLKLKIASPPVDGKANRAIIAYLAELLGLGKSEISLLHGTSGRIKLVEVPDSAQQKLAQLPHPQP